MLFVDALKKNSSIIHNLFGYMSVPIDVGDQLHI